MNSIQIDTTEIRQLDGLYSLNDLHKASGGRFKDKPANFLRVEQTQALIKEISQCSHFKTDENTQVSDMSLAKNKQGANSQLAIKVKHGGDLRGTFACKELVYAYAMWISPQFTLEVIRTFDALQTSPAPVVQETPSLINRRWLISYNHLGQEQVHAVPADACVMTTDEFVNALLDPSGISLNTEQQAKLIAVMAKRLANKTAFYQAKVKKTLTNLNNLTVFNRHINDHRNQIPVCQTH